MKRPTPYRVVVAVTKYFLLFLSSRTFRRCSAWRLPELLRNRLEASWDLHLKQRSFLNHQTGSKVVFSVRHLCAVTFASVKAQVKAVTSAATLFPVGFLISIHYVY